MLGFLPFHSETGLKMPIKNTPNKIGCFQKECSRFAGMIGFFQFFPDQSHFSPGVHLIFTGGWSIIRFVELSAFQNMPSDHIMHIM